MAAIKDKIVTVESLSSLHEYNKKKYVNKDGDIMTGVLILPNMIIQSESSNTSSIGFRDADNDISRGLINYDGNTNHRFYFSQYHPDQNDNSTRYSDRYVLPASTQNKTEDNWYNILTSKNVVTISQGGTNSSDGAIGLANLFASGETVLSSYQYGDELPPAGTKGRVFFKRVIE